MLRSILYSFLLSTICLSVYAQNNCPRQQCIAVVDAGSTGSRIHVYAYDLDKTNTPEHINEIWSKKLKPGFSNVELNQNLINNYLDNLFSNIPIENLGVYFYATAGMRLLPQGKQKAYYQALENWFGKQNHVHLNHAKTLYGQEEALFDWLAVNYHHDTFKSHEYVGVLDIGGASTQIAFVLKDDIDHPADSKNKIKIKIYDQKITVYIQSFLGLGQNEMSHQLLDTAACFPENYPLTTGHPGVGDATTCTEAMIPLINEVHKVNTRVQPLLQQNPTLKWYALGGIVSTAESKPFQFEQHQFTMDLFLQQGQEKACHQPWDDLYAQYPYNEFIDIYCLLPAYYYALIVHGYGFSPTQAITYVPANNNLDWTLGVVLFQSVTR